MSNLDLITIKGISALGYHGVYPEERTQGQPFVVDLVLGLDTQRAAESDDLDDTLNYAQVAKETEAILTGEPVDLLETLAQRIAQQLFQMPLLQNLTVTVHKPKADLGVSYEDVSVSITRDREWARQHPLTIPQKYDSEPQNDAQPEQLSQPEPLSQPESPKPAEPQYRAEAPEPVATTSATRAIGLATAASSHARQPQAEAAAETHGTEICNQLVEEPVVLSLGGNQGDVRQQMLTALEAIIDNPAINVEEVSPLVRTRAQLDPGAPSQPDYLNCVVIVKTTMTLGELFDFTQNLEEQAGRKLGLHWQPRPLDIDLINAGSLSGQDTRLTLPHPRAHQRAFVLVPWLAVDENAQLAGLGPVKDQPGNKAADIIKTWDDWLTVDPKVNLGEVVGPRTLDTDRPDEVPHRVRAPRRRPIRELFNEADEAYAKHRSEGPGEHDAPDYFDRLSAEDHDETPTLTNLVSRTTTQRRVVVRPTTTGTIPILTQEQLEQMRMPREEGEQG
ncbi:hypothetical protein BSR28_05700 [Boudabousia liubingyangii]|uniref:dihydroneopterin aldolase n=1 Tax=Boudabousia liubingyangii TaxID=1921764 RepID=UPI00093BBC5F|nr:dihydroneopterin aldolase [Boudabousia liubingyangii]OKL46917.1 hypothetical protein BSR28_05700 [Boudabousia liubingyangii]